MAKQLKGVIAKWRLEGGRIYGICVLHKEAKNMDANALANDSIIEGYPMTTSTVLWVNRDWSTGALIAETKNSQYILI